MALVKTRSGRENTVIPTSTRVNITSKALVPVVDKDIVAKPMEENGVIRVEGRELSPTQWNTLLRMEVFRNARNLEFTDDQADRLMELLVRQYPCPAGRFGNQACHSSGVAIKSSAWAALAVCSAALAMACAVIAALVVL